MAQQTAAQKAAAAKTLAANQAMLAKTEALLSKSKAKLSALQNPATVKATDYATRNAGFEATGAIRSPEDVAKILNPAKPVVEPVVPTPLVDTKFKKAQAGIRASLKAAKVDLTSDAINSAIEFAWARLPKA